MPRCRGDDPFTGSLAHVIPLVEMSGHAYPAAAMSPRRPTRSGAGSSGAAGALGLAGLCVLSMVAVWVLAELVPAAQLKDAVALHDFTLLSRPAVDGPAEFLLHLLDPLQFVLWGIALVAVALARERPRVALAIVAVMALAPFTAETLKPLAAHPHMHVGAVQCRRRVLAERPLDGRDGARPRGRARRAPAPARARRRVSAPPSPSPSAARC